MELNLTQSKKLQSLIKSLKNNNSRALGYQNDNTSILGSGHIVVDFNGMVDLSEFTSKSEYNGDFIKLCESSRKASDKRCNFNIDYNTLAQVLKGNVKKSDMIRIIISDDKMKFTTTQKSKEFELVSEVKLDQDSGIDYLALCFNMQYLKRIVDVMKSLTDMYGNFDFKFDVVSAVRSVIIESDNVKAYILPIRNNY